MFNREGRTPTHGYEGTPEAAMVAFAKSWRNKPRIIPYADNFSFKRTDPWTH